MARRTAAERPQASIGRPEYAPVPIDIGPVPDKEFLAAAMVAPASSATTNAAAVGHFQTEVAYRQLICSGISSQEAAGLIGYVIGLAPCESRWSIAQVNGLLFLRDLYLNTEWGQTERAPIGKLD